MAHYQNSADFSDFMHRPQSMSPSSIEMPFILMAANHLYFYDDLFSTLKLVQKMSQPSSESSNKALIAASQIAGTNFVYS